MFSRFFIDRPIFAAVLSLFIVLAGLAAMRTLPVAQYPEIAPPVVTVQAIYPGASAETLEQTVAAPLENQITGIEKMIYMSSTSGSNGVLQIQVTFEIGADADKAALDVNNRVKQAEPRLPEEVRRQGVTVQKGSSAFLQVLAFTSPDGRYDNLYISNYVTLNILDALKRVPGTTNVQIFGAKDYAMRIWVRPDRLTQLRLTPTDIIRALSDQNAQFAAGKIGQSPDAGPQQLVYTITTKGRLSEVREFEDIIVRANPDGSKLRLKDVARVELGSRDYEFVGRINGREATLVGVFLLPGANALEVAKEVVKTVDEIKQRFPAGLEYRVPYDTTRFVKVSIREVVITLAEAMLLVVLVVFLFLQNWRATLIPVAAVPVSLIGTFAGLHLLGYSINTLTLFGMVLAIGIVVDDAIVVLENIERIMHEERLAAREAAIKAMQEVSGPVVAIVLVLCSVFVPIAFLGGLAGELYRQFAVTIAIAVVISGIVALTLTPSLCVLILKQEHRVPGGFFRWFNDWFRRATDRYENGVAWMIRRGAIGLLLFGGMVAVAAGLWRITPGSLVPDEDQGYYIAAVILPDGATLERTDKVVAQVVEAIKSNPANEDAVAFTGFDFLGGYFRNNAATIFVTQKPWDERKVGTKDLVGELFMKTAGIKEALVLAFAPPPIFGLGQAGGFELYLQNRGEGGAQRMAQVMGQFIQRANADGKFAYVQTLWRPGVPQLYVDLDRDRAKALGVPLSELYGALAATLGSYYVNDFNKFGRTWQVLMSAEPAYRMRPEDVGNVYVRGEANQMIPLASLATIRHAAGPDSMTRFNNLPAVKLFGQGAPGTSSGQAIAEAERLAAEVLPADFSYDWGGASYQEKKSGGTSGIALGLAVVMVFLILAAQYERWSLPFSVLMALPFGTFGALAAVHLRGYSNDVYFQIGLVTLLGLAAKNAILIVQFLMTSLAFIFGVLPLALSSGAGAGARRSVGTGVMGGMLAATFLAIFFVPMFFKLLTDRHLVEKRSTAGIREEIEQAKRRGEAGDA
jgi:hydrophobe/amphiphile efflux-1 (HAE1) family protein